MDREALSADPKRFGTYLRRIREERRLSLGAVEQLSAAGPERLTKSHLSRMENGQSVPTFSRLFALSRIYRLPVSCLAERFELSVAQDPLPTDLAGRPAADVLDQASRLRRTGDYDQALRLYEALLDRGDRVAIHGGPPGSVDLTLSCINCMVKLGREALAKEECEKLLGHGALTLRQRFSTLHYFAVCCYHMGRYGLADLAIEKAERELAQIGESADLPAHLANVQGNLAFVVGAHAQAAEAYQRALARFEAVSDRFEAGRVRLNLAAAMIELGDSSAARTHLREALHRAEAAGYERQQAFALSHLGLLAFREDHLDVAEAHCIRSNRIARPREYLPILFRNCYYLWRVAQARRDGPDIKANERTLRTYLSRVEQHIPEAQAFRNAPS